MCSEKEYGDSGSQGLKRIAWEELEHDKDCQRGGYHYKRKEHLSESSSEGRLMEGAPLLSQGLIPNNHTLLWFRTLMKESVKGQLKPPLETSVY